MKNENTIVTLPQLLYEWVTKYLKRSWRVVPIPLHQKSPVIPRWRELNIGMEDLSNYFPRASNVGVITGEPSGNLCVADLDCPEANEIADEFLPSTGIEGGRESQDRSHRFYKLKGALPKTLRCSDPTMHEKDKRAMIAEFIVNGQVIVAPSIYDNGEKCIWHKFEEPAEVDAETLTKATYLISSVVLLSRFWNGGMRQFLALHLAGALAHGGYIRSESKKIIGAVCRLAKDEELQMRLSAVDTTFDAFEHGDSVTGWPTIEKEELFDTRVIQTLKLWLGNQPKAKKKAKPSITDVVREILIIIHTFLTQSREVFVTYPTETGAQTRDLDSREFCGWIRNYFFENYDHILDSGTLKNILLLLAHKAQPTNQKVNLRVARDEEATIYIDLNNAARESVQVKADGWEIIKHPPVIFRQGSGSKSFPLPEQDGQIEELLKFVNLSTQGEKLLFLTWLVAALMDDPPYSILVLQAEQGSGKSVITKLAHEMIDPNLAVRRAKPINLSDLIVAAHNNHLIEMDNISALQGWQSDALCQMATGGAFAKRVLYSDLSEITFSAARPILVSGIVDPTSRPDFLDRTIIIRPKRLGENRREESELWAEFYQKQGQLFGALLDVLCGALKHLPDVPKPKDSPRMINFARLGVAVERTLGWEEGLFEHAYRESRDLAMVKSLESSSVAQALINFMQKKSLWTGKAGKLWEELNQQVPWGSRPIDWPRGPKGMADALSRIAPSLRSVGLEISQSKKTSKNSHTYDIKRTELWEDANITEKELEIDSANFLNKRKE
jgi:hypothetical protein